MFSIKNESGFLRVGTIIFIVVILIALRVFFDINVAEIIRESEYTQAAIDLSIDIVSLVWETIKIIFEKLVTFFEYVFNR